MSKKPYDLSIIVGRFQPLHNGHVNLINKAISMADNTIVFIGYSGFTDMRHFLNHWTITRLIEEKFADEKSLHTFPLQDMADDRKWVYKLNTSIQNMARIEEFKADNICYIGSKKDVVWYCDLLPAWDLMLIPDNGINATQIRKDYFCGSYNKASVPDETNKELEIFKADKKYDYDNLASRFRDYYSIF